MDIYKKILVIVIVLVYLNALALFMIDRMTTDSIIGYDGKVIPDPSRVIDLSGAVKSQDVAGDALKRTKDGEVILYDNLVDDLELSDFIFNQEEQQIKTTIVKFRVVQVRPDDVCYKEIVYENISALLPSKGTAFAASDVIDPEVLGLNPSEVDFSVLNQIRFGGNVTVDEN